MKDNKIVFFDGPVRAGKNWAQKNLLNNLVIPGFKNPGVAKQGELYKDSPLTRKITNMVDKIDKKFPAGRKQFTVIEGKKV